MLIKFNKLARDTLFRGINALTFRILHAPPSARHSLSFDEGTGYLLFFSILRSLLFITTQLCDRSRDIIIRL